MVILEETKKLKIGIIGIGVGAAGILPAMDMMPGFELCAGADVNPITRDRFSQSFPRARVFSSAEELCADDDVDAVWVASPNKFHAEHAILAAQHGKHVIVEKPMALTIADAELMVEASSQNGVQLLCGHTVSDPIPIRAMRKIIRSGKIGDVRAIQMFSYTDWLIRARAADELDPAQGGGLIFRQGPRQVDTVRMIADRRAISVRGMADGWMPERPITGFYTAYIEFEGNLPCQILHNGHGYFTTGELIPWASQSQQSSLDRRLANRRALRDGTRDEALEKQEMRIGGSRRAERSYGNEPDWQPGDPGIVIVSCSRGDMRHSRRGLYVYDDDGTHEIDLERGNLEQRREELLELYRAVVDGDPLPHGGEWGLSTLEICLGIVQSGREHREISLEHQGSVPDSSDEDITIPYLLD